MSYASPTLGILLPAVFEELNWTGLQYCLLRGGEPGQAAAADIDLLVAPVQLSAFVAIVERFGFLQLPAWGHRPHHFFLSYDPASDRWIKLDIVTEVAFGDPLKTLRTDLADRCLSRRRRGPVAFVPAPDDEFLLLLLHCLLDKGGFPQPHRSRLVELCRQIEEHKLMRGPRFLAEFALLFPARLTWPRVSSMLTAGQWGDLLPLRSVAVARLERGHQLDRLIRTVTGRLLRQLDRARSHPGLTVALLAPDGGGKTTLAARIAERCPLPVDRIYMGSNAASSTVDLPVSRWLRTLARSSLALVRPFAPALHLGADLLELWYRYAVGVYRRRRGHLVLFDRYGYDALAGPPATMPRERLRRWLTAHACPAPDLVVYLDAPAEELYRRKAEHSLEWLEQQRQGYLRLASVVPKLTVLDATQPPEEVRRQLNLLIWRTLTERFGGRSIASGDIAGPAAPVATAGGNR